MLSLIMFSIQTYNVLDYLLINYPLTKNLPSALIQYILTNKKNYGYVILLKTVPLQTHGSEDLSCPKLHRHTWHKQRRLKFKDQSKLEGEIQKDKK